MVRDFANTLEAIANLLYLARISLDDKVKADAYLSMAEDIIETAAKNTDEEADRP